jgi:glycosyltransferase involved in cell wall biosynthesis
VNIGVDIKALFAGTAGIAAYIRNTLDSLQELDRVNRYFLFEKKPSKYAVKNPLWQKVLVPSRLPGTLWLMAVLPSRLPRYSIEVFWGPEQIVPCVLPARAAMVSTVLDVAVKRCPRTMQTTNYFINKLFLKRSIGRSQTVLTISRCIRDDICRFFPRQAPLSKVEVTYPGRPREQAIPEKPIGRGDHLLFAGSFEPRKNLLFLLKALALLKTEKSLTVPLCIAGPGGWKNSAVYKYIETSGLAGQIKFLGFLSDADLTLEYRRCKAFVYPSLYEGFGLPVLEALSAGAPVLSSRGTAMEEVAGECIVLFDPADPRDIADKISALYSGAIDTGALLANREAVLSRFSWESTARQTLDALTRACTSSGSHARGA